MRTLKGLSSWSCSWDPKSGLPRVSQHAMSQTQKSRHFIYMESILRLPFSDLISILLIYKMGTRPITLRVLEGWQIVRVSDNSVLGTQLELRTWSLQLLLAKWTVDPLQGQAPFPHSQLRLQTWVSCVSGCKGPILAWNRDGPFPLLISANPQAV